MIQISLRRIIPMFNDTRIAKHDRVVRNVTINICIWSNQYIIANSYLPNYCRINAYPNIIANNWHALP